MANGAVGEEAQDLGVGLVGVGRAVVVALHHPGVTVERRLAVGAGRQDVVDAVIGLDGVVERAGALRSRDEPQPGGWWGCARPGRPERRARRRGPFCAMWPGQAGIAWGS